MMTMTKERESVLDPWEETLFEMEAEKRPLAEAKTAEARKSDQFKALEGCQERLDAYPKVQKLFEEAFAALGTKLQPV